MWNGVRVTPTSASRFIRLQRDHPNGSAPGPARFLPPPKMPSLTPASHRDHVDLRGRFFRYKKGGKGSLVKCYRERIVEDHTDGKFECPGCGQEFARPAMIHGKPAFKMIGGKVFQK